MALRLGNQVVRGEIFNTRRHSVHGWLELRDWDRPLLLELTGNCDPDLAGWHIRFEARPSADPQNPIHRSDDTSGERNEFDRSGVAPRQIGATGTMTAARQVKSCDCPPKELYLRSKLGEPPPFEWKRCLYLEWYSQNGRVVVELADPLIEFVEFTSLEGGSATDPAAGKRIEQDADPAAGDLRTPSIPVDEEGEEETSEEILNGYPEQQIDKELEDPYGLIPKELQRQFDSQAFETDRALETDDDTSRTIRELELMDDLIENSPGEPLVTIFDNPVRLPHPDRLDDEGAEQALKSLLAQLALFGIAVDICEHFTPRDAYRLLVEKICPEERAYPELRHTQWVQHFATSDFCEKCEEEFERDFERNERRRKDNPDDELPDDGSFSDDLPF